MLVIQLSSGFADGLMRQRQHIMGRQGFDSNAHDVLARGLFSRRGQSVLTRREGDGFLPVRFASG
jgi:hypothetical protein